MMEYALAGMSGDPDLYDEPTKVTAKKGEVILDGPDGVDVKLAPEAARETSTRFATRLQRPRVRPRARTHPASAKATDPPARRNGE